MKVYQIDPVRDLRWSEFLALHPQSSIFHTRGWLEALQSTYGYQPLAFTTSEPGQPLQNAVAFAEVSSWLTGARMVSLPFSDHCQPLLDRTETLPALISHVLLRLKQEKCKYVEIRPLDDSGDVEQATAFGLAETFAFHALDLRPDLTTLYKGFHKSCIQRKIKRAEKEGLRYEVGCSEQLLEQFYALLLITRRRHQLPPQPRSWFRNLVGAIGENLSIHVVSKGPKPIATILTLRHKNTLIYKYGCSDAEYHKLGGMILLFWQAIQEGKASGAEFFDMGRSEMHNAGLIEFKGHWGAPLQQIHYYRFPSGKALPVTETWKMRLFKSACAYLPDPLLQRVGNILYRHVG